MHRILTLVVIALIVLIFTPAPRAAAAGEAVYPKLAMWYPGIRWNTWADASRFDLLIGDFNETGGFLDRNVMYSAPILRGYNEDVSLFTYFTNGVIRYASLVNEMNRYPNVREDSKDRWYLNETATTTVSKISMGDWNDGWFLTEAGTTTAADISAELTTIKVSDWQQTGPVKGNHDPVWDIFRIDHDVLCSGEIMRVIALDQTNETITVLRGMNGTMAATHPAGTRIAPIIRFWAGSYMMNLCASCPQTEIHGADAPETWADYSFRLAQTGRTDWLGFIGGDQNGFLFDFMGDEISWTLWQLARSIDLNHDNVPDDFNELDADWRAGIDYMTSLFNQRFPDAPIIRNNSRGLRFGSYDGENFENWPSWRWDEWDLQTPRDESLTKYWHRNFFGEVSMEGDPAYEEVNVVEVGGIIEFSEQGRQPNYSLVCSNEFETDLDVKGRPEFRRRGIGGGESIELAEIDPYQSVLEVNWIELFDPDYQKMRWGLCTSLLAGTYYCYAIHSDGFGLLGLRWFDEYDDAGNGKGYLGVPVGEVTQLTMNPGNLEWGTWGREYSGGYVIVNPTGVTAEVPLPEGSWRRINGEQQPEVNSGALEQGTVMVPAFDGLILKREV